MLVSGLTRFFLASLVAAGLLLPGACYPFEAGVRSGQVTGNVLTAPTCPVERIGQECPPRAVSGATVVALDGEAVRGSTLTDTAGAFSFTLPDGDYVIKATNVGGYASTATEHVVVSDSPVHITLVVDSGIR